MPDDTARTSMPDPTVQTPAPDDDRTPPSGIPVQQAPAGWPTTPYQGLQQQQPLPQPPPPTPPRRRRKGGPILLAIGVVVVLLIAVHTIVQNLSDSGAYDDGHQAYQKADCRAAIAQFDEALDSWQVIEFGDSVQRAQAEKDECVLFQNAVDNEAGNASAALIAYGGALVAAANATNDAFLTLNESNASFIACRPAHHHPEHQAHHPPPSWRAQ